MPQNRTPVISGFIFYVKDKQLIEDVIASMKKSKTISTKMAIIPTTFSTHQILCGFFSRQSVIEHSFLPNTPLLIPTFFFHLYSLIKRN